MIDLPHFSINLMLSLLSAVCLTTFHCECALLVLYCMYHKLLTLKLVYFDGDICFVCTFSTFSKLCFICLFVLACFIELNGILNWSPKLWNRGKSNSNTIVVNYECIILNLCSGIMTCHLKLLTLLFLLKLWNGM